MKKKTVKNLKKTVAVIVCHAMTMKLCRTNSTMGKLQRIKFRKKKLFSKHADYNAVRSDREFTIILYGLHHSPLHQRDVEMLTSFRRFCFGLKVIIRIKSAIFFHSKIKLVLKTSKACICGSKAERRCPNTCAGQF